MSYHVMRYNGRRWEANPVLYDDWVVYCCMRSMFRKQFNEAPPSWLARFRPADRIKILSYALDYNCHPIDQCLDLLARKIMIYHPNGAMKVPPGRSCNTLLWVWLDQSPLKFKDAALERECAEQVTKIMSERGHTVVLSTDYGGKNHASRWALGMSQADRALFDGTPARASVFMTRDGFRQDYWYDVPVGLGALPSIYPRCFKWGLFDELVERTGPED